MADRYNVAMRSVAVILLLVIAGGCARSPLVSDLPRTPYERYQVLRGQERPENERNEFGAEVPALRERLRPLGEP